jgi:NADH dehydrogenase/NADH:ubiquinone oxidoreductase subunit G
VGKITAIINGSPVVGREGMTILEVARENDIAIPTLCYHEKLTPIGACRLCIVEVEGSRTLVASCYTPITPGMVIHTHSPKVIKIRRIIVELMLAGHPDSCLVCDKANICDLRRIAADLEVGLPRFRIRKRYYPIEDVSPYITRDMSKCVQCWRCVRSCREIAKQNVFGIGYRGFDSKVIVDLDEALNKEACRDCDVCISFCPTGALCKVSERREAKAGKPLVITAKEATNG